MQIPEGCSGVSVNPAALHCDSRITSTERFRETVVGLYSATFGRFAFQLFSVSL